MKKISVLFVVLAISLIAIIPTYAQSGGAVITLTVGSVVIDGVTFNAPLTRTVQPRVNIAWSGNVQGNIAFPGGQSIPIAGCPNGLVTEIAILSIPTSQSQLTNAQLVSGCVTVDVPQGSVNTFSLISGDGQTTVNISRPASARITQSANGELVVERLSGDGTIQIIRNGRVVNSNVGTSGGTTPCGIPILNASGVGIGFVPCP